MKLKRTRKNPIVPMYSMSDIAFELLIFIMLVSLINYRQEVKIDYPEAASAKKTSVEKNMEIWVDRNGSIYLNGNPSDMESIELAVTEIYRTAPDTRLHIIADRATPFKYINGILELLQLLQYRVVSFVVKDA